MTASRASFLGAFFLFIWTTTACLAQVRMQGGIAAYHLGAGDGIRITVFQNPDLTLETRVGGDGSITYPLIGSIKVGGLTVSRAEQAIASALQNGRFIKHPQVSILVTQIRSHLVSVLGEASHPGSFPLETFDARVSTIIAMAGGPICEKSSTGPILTPSR